MSADWSAEHCWRSRLGMPLDIVDMEKDRGLVSMALATKIEWGWTHRLLLQEQIADWSAGICWQSYSPTVAQEQNVDGFTGPCSENKEWGLGHRTSQ
ncbi:hypothetical protein chiPu_0022221 [Chiloscyllium punctatum]|uniref:Uncharacterized protein n=1 Tax=Chiloscyllium punctatum TaxID=137246 RepID=A0A401REG1_CHIPU|nr:hypothetical protein [Chiloscyllium punctatum]